MTESIVPVPISEFAGLFTLLACLVLAAGITRFAPVPALPQNRLGCIDGLRGFLAIGVFMHHYVVTYRYLLLYQWGVPPSAFYTISGQAGVVLFFMVTGFLFWYKLPSVASLRHWLRLYISRIFRLVPLYWFVVACVLLIVFSKGGTELHVPLDSVVTAVLTWLSFRATPSINAFFATGRIVALSTWTLRYEWTFYLALPLLALMVRATRRARFLLLGAAAAAAALSYMELPITGLNLNTRYFVFFAVGAFFASLYRREGLRKIAESRIVSAIAISSLVLLVALFENVYGQWQLLLLSIFFGSVAMGNSLFGILKLPAAIFLGEISYSIYLLHGLVLYTASSILFPHFMAQETPALQLEAAMPALGVVLVLLSWGTFSLIENPGIRLGKRIAFRIGNQAQK